MSAGGSPILVLLMLVVPAVSAIAAAALGDRRLAAVRWLSLAATCLTLVLSLAVTLSYAGGTSAGVGPGATFEPRLATRWDLVRLGTGPGEAAQFYIGIDGLNVWLVLLTALLMVPAVLVSWTSIRERVAEYYAWLLALETAMLGVFLAFDILLFYVFFELTLVPLFFLIGIWGGPERRYAARKFFLYTLAGSLITLLGVLGVVLACRSDPAIRRLTFSIPELVALVNGRLDYLAQNPADFASELASWRSLELWVFVALIAGLAIKVPLVPLHTWLPLAHVEAPTAGSVLLAGVLLKVGAYGFLRLCLPLTPDACVALGAPLVGTVAVVGIVYGALCALAQNDIKRLVAYSSVSHLGFCMVGMFALNAAGINGSVLQMVNHGLSTGALFLLVGMMYERYHTRLLADYGGLSARLPLLGCFMVFFCLTSVGLPGLNGFIGEILVLMGVFGAERAAGLWPVLGVTAATGVVLGAWYLLTMLQRVFFGPVREPHGTNAPDLGGRELAALVPVAACCLLIGVYPQPVLNTIDRDVGLVAGIVGRARERAPSMGEAEASSRAKPDARARAGGVP